MIIYVSRFTKWKGKFKCKVCLRVVERSGYNQLYCKTCSKFVDYNKSNFNKFNITIKAKTFLKRKKWLKKLHSKLTTLKK